MFVLGKDCHVLAYFKLPYNFSYYYEALILLGSWQNIHSVKCIHDITISCVCNSYMSSQSLSYLLTVVLMWSCVLQIVPRVSGDGTNFIGHRLHSLGSRNSGIRPFEQKSPTDSCNIHSMSTYFFL